jgi:hypothetical protein
VTFHACRTGILLSKRPLPHYKVWGMGGSACLATGLPASHFPPPQGEPCAQKADMMPGCCCLR